MQPTHNSTRLDWLEWGRFAAALAVVFFHLAYNGIQNGKLSSISHFDVLEPVVRHGYMGVDFFFLISGFVIVLASQGKTFRQFVVGRVQRLYPAYLAAMTLTFFVALSLGTGATAVTWPQYFANLTMFAPTLGFPYVDGVYWTLKLEIQFYAAFAFVLLLWRDRLVAAINVWTAALLIVQCGSILSEPAFRWWQYQPLLSLPFLYFAAGSNFALLFRSGPTRVRVLLLVLLSGLIVGRDVVNASTVDAVIRASTHAVFLAFFAWMSCWTGSRTLRLPLARSMGALTYPLYLLHAHLGYMLLSHFADDSNKWIALIAQIALSLALAALTNLVIERRLKGLWITASEATFGRLATGIESAKIRIPAFWRKPESV